MPTSARPQIAALAALAAVAATLSACGGGGSGSTPTAADGSNPLTLAEFASKCEEQYEGSLERVRALQSSPSAPTWAEFLALTFYSVNGPLANLDVPSVLTEWYRAFLDAGEDLQEEFLKIAENYDRNESIAAVTGDDQAAIQRLLERLERIALDASDELRDILPADDYQMLEDSHCLGYG